MTLECTPPCTLAAQAGEPFPIVVRFKPTAQLLERCSRHVVDALEGVLEVPMRLNVPDQKLPVNFTLRAQVRGLGGGLGGQRRCGRAVRNTAGRAR